MSVRAEGCHPVGELSQASEPLLPLALLSRLAINGPSAGGVARSCATAGRDGWPGQVPGGEHLPSSRASEELGARPDGAEAADSRADFARPAPPGVTRKLVK